MSAPRNVGGPPHELLDDIELFLGRFVAYPSEAARVAHVLWIAHTWFMDRWDSTPRLAFLSPEPGSGKSRALEVTELLVPHPVHCVNVSPAYLFRRVSDPEGAPTLLYDEIDTVFGPRAKDNEDIRGMLNAGHRHGATAGRCVIKGKTIETVDFPAYCAVALAGLDDLPDTIMTRSVVIRMRRRAPSEVIEPWRRRVNAPEAARLGARLGAWAELAPGLDAWPEIPAGIEDRNADVWEALLAVGEMAGKHWPDRAQAAATAIVAASADQGQSLNVQLLRDIRIVLAGADRIATDDLIDALVQLEESPWGNMRGKPLEARSLARRLGKYGVKPRVIRVGETTIRGYSAADLADAWQRYLPVTSVTSVTSAPGHGGDEVTPRTGASWEQSPTTRSEGIEPLHAFSPTDVTDVTDAGEPHWQLPGARCEHGFAPEQTFHECGEAP